MNGDSTEEVVRVFEIAAQWRQTFGTDVVIDVIGYRRHGHNEIDQPLFTQPLMYAHIAKHPTPLNVYKQHLIGSGALAQAEVDEICAVQQAHIEAAFEAANDYNTPPNSWMADNPEWAEAGINEVPQVRGGESAEGYGHGVAPDVLSQMMEKLIEVPEGFKVHRGIERVLKQREQSFAEGAGIDWSSAEALAVGSLLLEGNRVRLSGQDVQRGTFSHRHAMVHDQSAKRSHVFVNHLAPDQEHLFQVCNSPLSEFGVLGFELGYSMESPKSLVMWEAQFGDFANGAQIIFDNFLCSMEAKWMRQSGLVCLLPHGYQGAGPEHSSCRIERFLQSSDEDPNDVPLSNETRREMASRCNWQVANPSTPANYFHLLRRQQNRGCVRIRACVCCRSAQTTHRLTLLSFFLLSFSYRKPLIVASTKALLRLPASFSETDDLTTGTRFHRVFLERFPEEINTQEDVKRIVMCSGKIYYELLEFRQKNDIKDVAIVSIEQILPFPFDRTADAVKE